MEKKVLKATKHGRCVDYPDRQSKLNFGYHESEATTLCVNQKRGYHPKTYCERNTFNDFINLEDLST